MVECKFLWVQFYPTQWCLSVSVVCDMHLQRLPSVVGFERTSRRVFSCRTVFFLIRTSVIHVVVWFFEDSSWWWSIFNNPCSPLHSSLSWSKPWKHCDKILFQNYFEDIFCHNVSKVYSRIDTHVLVAFILKEY